MQTSPGFDFHNGGIESDIPTRPSSYDQLLGTVGVVSEKNLENIRMPKQF